MNIVKARKGEHPLCPHCEKEIQEMVAKQCDKSWFKVTEKYIYYCPHCKKVLGIGQSAWMP